MPEFVYRNVNDAFRQQTAIFKKAVEEGYDAFGPSFITTDSRNGPVIRYARPVTMIYTRPTERVLFSPERNANPFFHLYEAIWMLAGRNDLASMTRFVSRFKDFSDDGATLHGAYGYRWRKYYGYDQLDWIVDELKVNPTSRRCVLQMWDGGRTERVRENVDSGMGVYEEIQPDEWEAVDQTGDLYFATHGGKDVPCNMAVVFEAELTDGSPKLHMNVYNRSNDLIWGALGANYVHFSFLQEYMARRMGYDVGEYRQISTNLHVYTERFDLDKLSQPFHDYYVRSEFGSVPLADGEWTEADELLLHVAADLRLGDHLENSLWFGKVFTPAMLAHYAYKAGNLDEAYTYASTIEDLGWKAACCDWLTRLASKLPFNEPTNKI